MVVRRKIQNPLYTFGTLVVNLFTKSFLIFSLSAIQIDIESNQSFMASGDVQDESLYPIAVLIDELRNEDVQVRSFVHADADRTVTKPCSLLV